MKRMIAVLLCLSCLLFAGCRRNASSIGIIGGADGPTSVFITRSN